MNSLSDARWEGRVKVWVQSDAFARAAPFLALTGILLFFSFSHNDDIDSLYYKSIAANMFVTHDWFRLVWPQLPTLPFNDHLSPGLWLIAICEKCLGDTGTHLFYAGLTVGTFYLLYRMAKRFALEREAVLAIWVVAFTENFIRMQALPRLDPPFLLLLMASLSLAGRFGVRSAIAAGFVAGLSSLLRAPPSMALIILVPALVLVQRSRETRRLTVNDVAKFALFLLAFALPLTLFHLADRHFSSGDAIDRYLHAQVLPSLQGSRSDGQPSHLAPLRSIAGRFWPGLVLCIAAAGFALRRGQEVPPFIRFSGFAAAVVVCGFSLGRRHIFTHVWPAYPGLFMVAAWGWGRTTDLLSSLPSFPRTARVTGFLPACGLAFMVLFVGTLSAASPKCDVNSARELATTSSTCGVLLVASADASKDWFTANRVVDHYGKNTLFSSEFNVPNEARIGVACRLLAFASSR